jgi:peroxiredoxin Q/BCP
LAVIKIVKKNLVIRLVKINQKAPDFCLKDQNDNLVCLNNFIGKWTIIYFYPKDNTPGCSLEARNFNIAAEEFKKQNTTIIGISPDSVDSHKFFCEKQNLNITLLSDSEHKTLNDYGVWKPKKMYGREFFGVIRSTFLINPEGKIAHIWPKVKVNGHVDNVKRVLNEKQKNDL